MDSNASLSSPDERPREQIFSVSYYYNGHYLLGNLHYFCLIFTEKRIICVRIDEIMAAGGKGSAAGLLRSLLFVISPDRDLADVCDRLRTMHPSAIVAMYPDAVSIPVNGVERFEVWKGKHFWCVESPSPRSYYWGIEIYGWNRRIQLFTKNYPRDLLDNYPLIRLFRGRFFPPTNDTFGWLLGKKTDE